MRAMDQVEALSEQERKALVTLITCALKGVDGPLDTATQAEKRRMVSFFVRGVCMGMFEQ